MRELPTQDTPSTHESNRPVHEIERRHEKDHHQPKTGVAILRHLLALHICIVAILFGILAAAAGLLSMAILFTLDFDVDVGVGVGVSWANYGIRTLAGFAAFAGAGIAFFISGSLFKLCSRVGHWWKEAQPEDSPKEG